MKNNTIYLNMTKKEKSWEKIEQRKKTKNQTNKGFISCPIIHTDKLLTVWSLAEAVLSVWKQDQSGNGKKECHRDYQQVKK